jgi:peptide/nickel transport system substrate-binding protein
MSAEVTIGIPFLEPVWPYVDPATDFTPISLNVVYNVYERLVELSHADQGGFQIEPGIAESWRVSDDGCTYQFQLDPKARFASGRAVSADDVIFSLKRLRAMAKPPSHLLRITGVTAVSDSRVDVLLERPSAAGLAALASPAFSIIDHESVGTADDLGQNWLTAHSAGSGPFTLQSLTDHEVILAANGHYWREPPAIGKVIFTDTSDPATQVGLLRDGQVDILLAASPAQLEECSRDPAFATDQAAAIHCPNLTLLKGTSGPDGRSLPENLAVGEAMKYGIDYEAVAELLGGWANGVRPAQTSLVPGVCGYRADLAYYYRYDPRRARRLLAAAGYPDGLDVDFPYWTGSWGGVDTGAVARALETSLRAAGIRARLKAYPGDEYFALLLDQRAMTGLTLSMSFYQLPDPEDVFRRKLSFHNLTGHQIDAEDALDAAAAELDWTRRAELYHELQLRFLTEAPMIYLLAFPHRAVRRAEITGYDHPAHWPGPRLAALKVAPHQRARGE